MNDDRLLEESVRSVLAAAEIVEGGAIDTSEEALATGEPRKLPRLRVRCRITADNHNVRHAGRYASDLELRVEIRVDAAAAESVPQLETLAASVRTTLEASTEEDWPDWHMLDAMEPAGDEHATEEGARVRTLIWTLVGLPI
jgi:hypothetical protein